MKKKSAYVKKVIDGDTFRIRSGSSIRLEGVDAPELDEPGGRRAKRRLQELVEHKYIRYEPKARDTYGRIVAQVWVGSINVNRAMRAFLGVRG